jgi:hypothetical protein
MRTGCRISRSAIAITGYHRTHGAALCAKSKIQAPLAVSKHAALEMVGDSSKMFLRYKVVGGINTDAHNEGQRLGDFNADGILDLVVANGGTAAEEGRTVSVLLGQGEAVFRAPKKYLVGYASHVGICCGREQGWS